MSDSHGSRWVGGIRDGSNDSPTEPYHFDVVRLSLTRSFPSRFDDICDEISASVGDMFGHSSAWNGVPLLVPGALKPLVGKLISPVATALRELEPILGPIIRERLHQDAVQGAERADRPKDLISWLLDFSPPEKRNVEVIFRIISLNFVSVHTTSITIANALFDLAAHPKYSPHFGQRRRRCGAIWLDEGGHEQNEGNAGHWFKFVTITLKFQFTLLTRRSIHDQESLARLHPFEWHHSARQDLLWASHSRGLHHDSEKYEDPLKFDGFRFLRLREKEEGGELKYQMVSLHHDYLLFGHGRSACPGRFFAVSEAKAVMAHILLNYDIKFPEGVTSHPAGKWFSASYTPHPSAQLLVRRGFSTFSGEPTVTHRRLWT
ncbi:cytochrome P450 [Coprinellus micaceus]|uniref:Cytochrome P450 n=1 Tax=Coprinellus micaceus TaxID=71717 RepID=A0A4Y7SDQ9_COPMI|nr:cytochrome P450 [Coprinellus micaceus]